ncbi:hypothetical protein [Pelagicoccus sp. SDUM812005]|uniref:hypothetical protein n=1 Tax=Pelagicoccus sp. SDUM812005 TaxID=3041257 RepID=UPI00280E7915|nr:hypothetical protein [Pelagicoccus sp. SDUM812005]MDQ8179798.1 hypothetical protein [Pelagicoccus sp. SDUM812005]
MILGQLIQTGRRFCECRSNDFVPKSEDTVIVLAYTIQDKFLAHSFDTDLPELKGTIKDWLFDIEAVGYLLIRRKPPGVQREFPSPIGREPMDQITLTAATEYEFKVVSYFLDEIEGLDSYRLVPTNCAEGRTDESRYNLFRFEQKRPEEDSRSLLLAFEEFAN